MPKKKPATTTIAKGRDPMTVEVRTDLLVQIERALTEGLLTSTYQPPRAVVPFLSQVHWDAMKTWTSNPVGPVGEQVTEWLAPVGGTPLPAYLWLLFPTRPSLGLCAVPPSWSGNIHQTPDPGTEPPPPNMHHIAWDDWNLIRTGTLDSENGLVDVSGQNYLLLVVSNTRWGDRVLVIPV